MAEFEPAFQKMIKHEGEAEAKGRSNDIMLCSDCFRDQGLRLESSRMGIAENSACPNCGSTTGRKLNRAMIQAVAHRFFVWGTLTRFEDGGAPRAQFNQHQSTSINTPPWLNADLRLIENALHVGFFHYGPRLWMVGEVEPLKALKDPTTRASVVSRIIAEFPVTVLSETEKFYRVRKDPKKPTEFGEYDSPPLGIPPRPGRLDSHGFPVMYASQDLQVCLHECRVTAEDELFVATLVPTRKLRLLDVTELLQEKATEFESLDMAVHMLFLAGEHSYEIAREIARAAASAGYDGLAYPSYFSLLRTGGMPFETSYGISHRMLRPLVPREKAKIIGNLALFGRPIKGSAVSVRCINRLILNRVEYSVHFGPVDC